MTLSGFDNWLMSHYENPDRKREERQEMDDFEDGYDQDDERRDE
ncbi:hypothetical protein LCGC14_0743300 [marine sediment metagenome]|uniref:Uncharacterized protein n=1 Tax=marine sediment metagenome TaxID=412755 RepID=A0A0F9Q639_9ZZZZ